ncbi:hypothetical protein QR685DRAFT_548000 [Neurospora intermedia]|uniref:Amidohydrolase-related domain-containing protein n=1 Tax=Neurospora intermedia TaxID=5142 RepID=A0ABR3D0Q6_NEUIN
MSASDEQCPLGGHAIQDSENARLESLNEALSTQKYLAGFHGDTLIGNKVVSKVGLLDDLKSILELKNVPSIVAVLVNYLKERRLDIKAGASLLAAVSNNSVARADIIEKQVKIKYDRMLHPPLSYLGDAFKYRTADGKFNSAINPHLGQAGAPYAKTVPAKTHPLGALPDPGDLFDQLMAREENGRPSQSGLSSMLIYHATIIIHDLFRTNDNDKNISDTSSYLDLSPLYGFTEEMQHKVRDETYGLGLLKPDTFAEDRLLRQPPGVCIMLVMYNRYHNYAATQLRRINENGRFSVPREYREAKFIAAAKYFDKDSLLENIDNQEILKRFIDANEVFESNGRIRTKEYQDAENALDVFINEVQPDEKQVKAFKDSYDAAWKKLDDDLFHTARLITCGLYIQVSVHDYLRALMGFHQYDTNFTLDPRVNQSEAKEVSRGLGNQVTVEFNLLYRFHCAISRGDEEYLENYLEEYFEKQSRSDWNPKEMGLQEFLMEMGQARERRKNDPPVKPCDIEFGLKNKGEDEARKKMAFKRDPITKLFNDEQMVEHLTKVMDEPISNFGPRNVPRSLKAVEVMGILQARKWGVGTLNDFREFFGMKRHKTFESVSGCVEVQNALRDLYEHPDKIEFYPGVFCESDASQSADPGPSDVDSALWAAIFSDAITLVRSDRFYTLDWNTNSLTSWGMKEVTPDNDVLKSSVFHRLLQRSFPEWFPSTSVRFFHPFYTAQKNAEYATAQGYDKDFAIKPTVEKSEWNWSGPATVTQTFDTSASNPRNPVEPKILTNPRRIMEVLSDTDNIVHPVRLEPEILPAKVAEVLAVREREDTADGRKSHGEHRKEIDNDTDDLMTYFTDLMRDIIRRESVVMKPGQKDSEVDPIYQLDVTRDFAIPVVTRYVADFLGFGHLVKSEKNLHAKYSENEIYQHITNCHLYFSYNADETKLPKRRKMFKDSMSFLFDLTLNEGNVAEVKKFRLTRALQSVGSWLWRSAAGDNNPMSELGLEVSQQVLQQQKGDTGRVAAILLLLALDSSYTSVLAFTSVLDSFMNGLYTLAAKEPNASSGVTESKSCEWRDVQRLACAEFLPDVPTNTFDDIKKIVLKAQRESMRLPILRKARITCVVKGSDPVLTVEKDQLIICDINPGDQEYRDDVPTYHTSFTERFTEYHPKNLAENSLTAMIKVLAQLKDLRRGNDTQGHLKKIGLDSSYATYTNFMAPQRIKHIKTQVRAKIAEAEEADDLTTADKLKKTYHLDRLQCPATDTYMTPEWDEMIPFPTTWKVRFNGYGESTYGGERLPLLQSPLVPDDFPPFYELPGGPSRTGGSFGEPIHPYPSKPQEKSTSREEHGENVLYMDRGSDVGDSAIDIDEGCPFGGIPEIVIKPWKPPPRRTYLFKGANLVDTAQGTIISNVNIKIADGVIKLIEKNDPRITSIAHHLRGEDDSGSVIKLDLEGKFLCPGLIDCHVHVSAVPGELSLSSTAAISDPAISLLRQPFVCPQMLSRGFTTVRDTGGATLALREAIEEGVFPGPRLFICNRALSQTGGHGDLRGAHNHKNRGGGGEGCCGGSAGQLAVVCDGVPECIRAAREQLRTGADFIKIMVGGGVASPTDRLTNTQFTTDEVRAICDVAESYGTYVTAHAYTPKAIRHAVDNGVKGIEHGNLIDEATARYMAERGIWLTPTLVTYDAMASDEYAGFLPPENQRKNEEVLRHGLKSLTVAEKAGVNMCYGSDLLGPLTREQSKEFGIRSVILKSKQVLQSATVNAAKMLGQESFLGQLKPGYAADMLILDVNPFNDVAMLDEPKKHVLAVIKDGRVCVSRWRKLPMDARHGEELIE